MLFQTCMTFFHGTQKMQLHFKWLWRRMSICDCMQKKWHWDIFKNISIRTANISSIYQSSFKDKDTVGTTVPFNCSRMQGGTILKCHILRSKGNVSHRHKTPLRTRFIPLQMIHFKIFKPCFPHTCRMFHAWITLWKYASTSPVTPFGRL